MAGKGEPCCGCLSLMLVQGLLQGMTGTPKPIEEKPKSAHPGSPSNGGPEACRSHAAVHWPPPATAVELNLRIRNSSLTEFAATPRRHNLISFNGVPHLDTAEPSLTTYA